MKSNIKERIENEGIGSVIKSMMVKSGCQYNHLKPIFTAVYAPRHSIVDGKAPEGYEKAREAFYDMIDVLNEYCTSEFEYGDYYEYTTYTAPNGRRFLYTTSDSIPYSLEILS